MSVNLKSKRFAVGVIISLIFVLAVCLGFSSVRNGAIIICFILLVSVLNIQLSSRLYFITHYLWIFLAPGVILASAQLMFYPGEFTPTGLNWLCNYLLLSFFILLLTAVCGKYRISVIIIGSLMLAFATLDYYVCVFRGTEIAPSDVYSLRTALNVAGSYKIEPVPAVFYSWSIFALFVLSAFSVSEQEFDCKLKKRSLCAAISVCMLALFLFLSRNMTAIHMINNLGIKFNGLYLNFVLQTKEASVEQPDGYSRDKAAQLLRTYKTTSSENDQQVDIIVIMNESFSDLSVLSDHFSTDNNPLSFFHSLSDESIHGYALSSVFGGKTPNSEFEFLTGNTMGFLPAGSIPYMQYIHSPVASMVSDLKSRDYTTIAMHPYNESGWARFRVYPEYLGFDQSYFLDYFPQKDMIRGYVSDSELYQSILEQFESKPVEQRLFIFAVTMQNHGSYDIEGYQSNIHIQGAEGAYPKAEQYLSVLHESDDALRMLISELKKIDRKVVVCMFGDHQPELESEFYDYLGINSKQSEERAQKMYTVPFVIWSNFDNQSSEIDLTSLNYLSGLVYGKAGLSLTPYQSFLMDLQQSVPYINSQGVYSEDQSGYVFFEDLTSKEKQLLEDYSILQYYYLFDGGGIKR